ncbi:MAG: HAD family hydrolase [Gemmatimonadetes bacterium]|nr:HAD family hydrolase [Gemmatimonadota bacterium]
MPLRPAVFVDRDGTIIVERSYLADPAGVALVPGVPDALRGLRGAGFAVVIVTNQSGIARGLYTEADYEAVTERLRQVLAADGVTVDGVEHCAHHPDVTGPCECRKPGTGMHRRAAAALGIDLARSYCVGDKLADVLPAAELGGRGILVRTGYGREHESRVPEGVRVVDDFRAAADLILGDRLR